MQAWTHGSRELLEPLCGSFAFFLDYLNLIFLLALWYSGMETN